MQERVPHGGEVPRLQVHEADALRSREEDQELGTDGRLHLGELEQEGRTEVVRLHEADHLAVGSARGARGCGGVAVHVGPELALVQGLESGEDLGGDLAQEDGGLGLAAEGSAELLEREGQLIWVRLEGLGQRVPVDGERQIAGPAGVLGQGREVGVRGGVLGTPREGRGEDQPPVGARHRLLGGLERGPVGGLGPFRGEGEGHVQRVGRLGGFGLESLRHGLPLGRAHAEAEAERLLGNGALGRDRHGSEQEDEDEEAAHGVSFQLRQGL